MVTLNHNQNKTQVTPTTSREISYSKINRQHSLLALAISVAKQKPAMRSFHQFQYQTDQPTLKSNTQRVWIRRHCIGEAQNKDVHLMQSNRLSFAFYRLSGDLNPMHIDPDFAKIGGQKQPIMHGLCTLGFSVRAVLQTYANNDPSLFKAVKVRFTKPAIPGQTLKIEMWQNESRIHFKTSIAETGAEVITGAYVDLKEVKKSEETNTSVGGVSLQSDSLFRRIKDRIAESVEAVKKINGVFLFNLTLNGKIVKSWSMKSGQLFESKEILIKIFLFQRST